ncbi:sensor histidine kinase [Novosphingobium sp. 9]|uniref:sensor histidine kinase n=1 Tax=Novosphingobium sp. 9 TaxID=2025349 RepID=UPI0021B688DC|nr:histidine kinase dimerization/phosphoacceptor domain -containing protein [Novosphingobium sp. 9]
MGQHPTLIERLPLLPDKPAAGYAFAVVLSLVALALRWQLDAAFPPGYPYLTFFPAVILTSFLFGPRPGIAAALVCGIFAWYFFIAPRGSFTFDARTQVALSFYGFVVAVDIALVHLMQAANRRLSAARETVHDLAEERGRLATRAEVLFQELQHRVGNNLQMIGAMLSLQQRGLSDPAARAALDDAARRLQVIGNIQRELYRHHGDDVPLDTFITDLATKLAIATTHAGVTIHVEAHSGRALRQGAAIPVALIVAEAIANAVEHGCPDHVGTVHIHCLHDAASGGISIRVRDRGPGLPSAFDGQAATSVGLRLSHVMAHQLSAELLLENDRSEGDAPCGVVSTLTLPHEHLLPHT